MMVTSDFKFLVSCVILYKTYKKLKICEKRTKNGEIQTEAKINLRK
jgi:hypothetical protein